MVQIQKQGIKPPSNFEDILHLITTVTILTLSPTSNILRNNQVTKKWVTCEQHCEKLSTIMCALSTELRTATEIVGIPQNMAQNILRNGSGQPGLVVGDPAQSMGVEAR